MKYILENNMKKIRKKENLNISELLDFMNWSNRSVLFKKENNITKISIKEALLFSKFTGYNLEKIFSLKVSKME